MKKLLLILACITLTLSFSNCSKNAKYKVVVEQMSKQLPMELPGGISMDKVEVDGDEFKYYYTFKQVPEMDSEEFIKLTKEGIMPMVKNQADLQVFRDDKMTFVFIYQKTDGSTYAEIKVTPEDYK